LGDTINLIPVSLALATAFSWVFGQVLGKLVVRELNPTIFNTIRFSIAAVLITPFVLITGIELAGTWPTVLAIVDGAFGMALSLQIYFYCMKRAPAHRVVTIGNASPVWTVLLALFLLGEGITALLPFSLALVILGYLLLVPKKEEPNNWAPAVPLAIIVSFLWALDQVL
jgi:drug/metabolite transporter (DMT)-like permease